MHWLSIIIAAVITMAASLMASDEDTVEFINNLERDPALKGPFRIHKHPSVTLSVAGEARKVPIDSGSKEPRFHFSIPLRITNSGATPVLFSGHGSWNLYPHVQIKKLGEKDWPMWEMHGICATGLKFFTLATGESQKIEAIAPSDVEGRVCRFGIGLVDYSLKPEDRFIISTPILLSKP